MKACFVRNRSKISLKTCLPSFCAFSSTLGFFITLQDFTVLPMAIFRRYVIKSSLVIYLPTSSPTEYVRRLSFRRYFTVPTTMTDEFKDGYLRSVFQTFTDNFTDGLNPSICHTITDGINPLVYFKRETFFLACNVRL